MEDGVWLGNVGKLMDVYFGEDRRYERFSMETGIVASTRMNLAYEGARIF
jgi:tetrahydromethanopterin S-methyltransferase subunit E